MKNLTKNDERVPFAALSFTTLTRFFVLLFLSVFLVFSYYHDMVIINKTRHER